MKVYYNEFDPWAAEWLRELIKAGQIPPGDVDERDIREVKADEITAETCHWFAGVAGWAYALRLAGWPADRPVWTASLPCQPFSSAGKRLGEKDERHLWPAFRTLVAKCRPAICFGEQVASKDGRAWLSGVRADLEALGYAVGAADLCAASVNAPHIRQRLYWVAYAKGIGYGQGIQRPEKGVSAIPRPTHKGPEGCGTDSGLGQSDRPGPQPREPAASIKRQGGSAESTGGGVGDSECYGPPSELQSRKQEKKRRMHQPERPGSTNHFWSDAILIPCADGKWRPVKSGIPPLAPRLPRGVVPGGDPGLSYCQSTSEARVMRLKGYGNSIIPQVAAEFIQSVMDYEV
ncbi:MAG: DNA cytosine methyltransferase [Chloroflexota bacterium]